VLVVGAGFTGSEVASICRQRDIPVTVVERAENPLVGPLDGVVGEVAAGLQGAAGVDLRCNVTVEGLEGSGGRCRAASKPAIFSPYDGCRRPTFTQAQADHGPHASQS
jgi:pyruvate/2-oxoglutarate dehydrogenase complex dihydrolipoamide dehydrogenase (E3) component